MTKKITLILLASISIAACNNFKKGEAGTEYKIVDHKGSGPTIKEGDIISLDGVMKTESDSVLTSTYEQGLPSIFMVQKPQYKGDFMWALTMLTEGDSVVIKMDVDSLAKYSKQPKPPGLKGKFYIYSLRVNKQFSKAAGEQDSVFQGRVTTYYKGLIEKGRTEEPAKIKKYIADKGLKVTTTATGLNYVITKQGTGPTPAVGDSVVVNYTGTFVNGNLFDTNIAEVAKKLNKYKVGYPYEPAVIPVGVHSVIQGWDEALQLLSKGSKATLVVPSNLGYADRGMPPNIAPYSPLVFDIEVLDVKPAKKP